MNKLINKLKRYILEVLSIQIAPQPWEKGRDLPPYLRQRYRFFQTEILGKRCILMIDADETEDTPAVVGKHLDQVRSRQDFAVIYVRDAVTSYNRRRLIDQKVPFIVPGNQMYLPMLGLDLREHFRRLRERKPQFRPSTQALILYVLWQKRNETLTPAEAADDLGYSPMAMTRAFDEIEAAGIGEHSVHGRRRHLSFAESKWSLWEKVLPYLSTPVKKRLNVVPWHRSRDDILAGESALAQYTMLSDPRIPVFAFSAEDWKVRKKRDKIRELAPRESGDAEIEIWKYSPTHFAEKGKVDRLSLYLSLKDNIDERVQSALDELLRGMEW